MEVLEARSAESEYPVSTSKSHLIFFLSSHASLSHTPHCRKQWSDHVSLNEDELLVIKQFGIVRKIPESSFSISDFFPDMSIMSGNSLTLSPNRCFQPSLFSGFGSIVGKN